jgi:hypothetical protein
MVHLGDRLEVAHMNDHPPPSPQQDPPVPAAPPRADPGALTYVVAVVLPVVGVVYGIVLLARTRVGPGLAMILSGIAGWRIWTAVLTGS